MDSTEQAPAYDVTTEVVEHCRELIRIDTSNYGDGSGRGSARPRSTWPTCSPVQDWIRRSSSTDRAGPTCSRDGRVQTPTQRRCCCTVTWTWCPPQAEDWSVDPFAAEVIDGYVYGRGAVDMKDFDAMILSVVAARQAAGVRPRRPVVLAFTADEEAGSGFGGHRLVEQQVDWFEGCTEAVGEVGGFSTEVGGQRLYLVESGEKGIAWLRLTATGAAGHGSMRHPDNAVSALASAIAAIGDHEWPVQPGTVDAAAARHVRELTGATSGDPDELIAAFGPAAQDDRRRDPQHHQPDHAASGLQGQRGARARRWHTSTGASCPASRTCSSSRCGRWRPGRQGGRRDRAARAGDRLPRRPGRRDDDRAARRGPRRPHRARS
jgi:hypothetical protein